MTLLFKTAMIAITMVAVFAAGLTYGEQSMSEAIQKILKDIDPCKRGRR